MVHPPHGVGDICWDEIVSIEALGERETFDLTIEEDHNFLANDFVVHNSHSSSFALLVYASSWLKLYYPAEKQRWYLEAALIYTEAVEALRRQLDDDAPEARGLMAFKAWIDG